MNPKSQHFTSPYGMPSPFLALSLKTHQAKQPGPLVTLTQHPGGWSHRGRKCQIVPQVGQLGPMPGPQAQGHSSESWQSQYLQAELAVQGGVVCSQWDPRQGRRTLPGTMAALFLLKNQPSEELAPTASKRPQIEPHCKSQGSGHVSRAKAVGRRTGK